MKDIIVKKATAVRKQKVWPILVTVAVVVMASVFGPFATYYDYSIKTQPVRIHTNFGGAIDDFITRFENLRDQNRKVIIDGMCMSSCTLALGLIKPENLCGSEFASLVFHSAFFNDGEGGKYFSKDGTEIAWHVYPPKVRALLRERGWNSDEHNDLIFVEGEELRSILPLCKS